MDPATATVDELIEQIAANDAEAFAAHKALSDARTARRAALLEDPRYAAAMAEYKADTRLPAAERTSERTRECERNLLAAEADVVAGAAEVAGAEARVEAARGAGYELRRGAETLLATACRSISAPLTASDRDELLSLPRANATKLAAILEDALSATGVNAADHGTKKFPATRALDRAREIAEGAGYLWSHEALGPRGGSRAVVRGRLRPEFRAGHSAVTAAFGQRAAATLAAAPEALIQLGDNPGLVELLSPPAPLGTSGPVGQLRWVAEVSATLELVRSPDRATRIDLDPDVAEVVAATRAELAHPRSLARYGEELADAMVR